MKKTTLHIITITLFLFIGSVCTQTAYSQPPPPSGHGNNENVPAGNGGGAPLAEGLGIMISLAAIYGSKKLFDFHSKSKGKD